MSNNEQWGIAGGIVGTIGGTVAAGGGVYAYQKINEARTRKLINSDMSWGISNGASKRVDDYFRSKAAPGVKIFDNTDDLYRESPNFKDIHQKQMLGGPVFQPKVDEKMNVVGGHVYANSQMGLAHELGHAQGKIAIRGMFPSPGDLLQEEYRADKHVLDGLKNIHAQRDMTTAELNITTKRYKSSRKLPMNQYRLMAGKNMAVNIGSAVTTMAGAAIGAKTLFQGE